MATRNDKDRPLDLVFAGGTFILGEGRRATALGVQDGRVAWIGAAEETVSFRARYPIVPRRPLPPKRRWT